MVVMGQVSLRNSSKIIINFIVILVFVISIMKIRLNRRPQRSTLPDTHLFSGGVPREHGQTMYGRDE